MGQMHPFEVGLQLRVVLLFENEFFCSVFRLIAPEILVLGVG